MVESPEQEQFTLINWKHEYLDLADRLDKFLDRHEPEGRVTELLHGYGKVVRALLMAEVNGGLDECYTDFPDAPDDEGCSEDKKCYCDLLKERDDFIVQKGLWMEFVGSLNVQKTEPDDTPETS